MLKFLFGETARFQIGRKLADLEADFVPINGYTGRGEIEYSAWADGSRQLEVELRGIAGRSADIHIDGTRVMSVTLNDGRVDKFFDTRQGDAIPEIREGSLIEVYQNSQPILSAVVERD